MKMNILFKNFLILSLTGAMTISLAGCSTTSTNNNKLANTETSNTESTLEKDSLIVGLDDTFAPLGFRDEKGELTGFDVELAKAIGGELGKEFVFQPIDWSMKEAELAAGNIDLIWNGYTITPARLEKVSFSKPYLKNKQSIVTLVGSPIKTKADLEGKKVGAQSESSAIDAMEKEADLYASFDTGEAITFEDNNQALMDLEAGRLDAVVADEILLRYYLTLKGADKFTILNEDFGNEEYGVGIKKGDKKMVEAFNAAYDELKANGTLKAISTKWFGEDITN